LNDLIFRAREFARERHFSQARRYTGEPYFVHLEEVAGLVERAGLSETAIAAAWLHDVVEDQGVPLQTIVDHFGQDVLAMVVKLTDTPPRPGINRDGRKAIDRQRLYEASPEVQGIKCADLISNTSTIVKHDPGFARRYLPEKRAILDVLTSAPAPLRDQAWQSLLDAERQLEAVNASSR
jgi:(p)ppGpp synthase/HD superfamily hydrolase